MGAPDVLILDEPTVGLDPQQIIDHSQPDQRPGEKAHRHPLLPHPVGGAGGSATGLVIINGGKIVADDTAESLTRRLSKDFRYIIRVEGPMEEIRKVLEGVPGMKEVLFNGEKEPGVYEFSLESDPTLDIRREIFRRIVGRSWTILSFHSTEVTLEGHLPDAHQRRLRLRHPDPRGERRRRGAAEAPQPEEPKGEVEEIQVMNPETGTAQDVTQPPQMPEIDGARKQKMNENGGEE